MGCESTAKVTKEKGGTEGTTYKDLEQEIASQKNQRKNQRDNGYAQTI